jgi:hypothetical protein
MSYVHIHAPKPEIRMIVRRACPTCKRNTFFTYFSYEWYGPSCTCLKCGDRWNDGEMAERPFARGWRKRSIQQAKKYWRLVTKATP